MLIRELKSEEFELLYNEAYEMTINSEIKYNNFSKEAADLIFNNKVSPLLNGKLKSKDNFFFAIEHENNYCGHLWLRITNESNTDLFPNGIIIMSIFLKEIYRNRKWSKNIMEFAELKCKELKIKKMYLGVFYKNEIAVNLYKKCGFRINLMDMVKDIE